MTDASNIHKQKLESTHNSNIHHNAHRLSSIARTKNSKGTKYWYVPVIRHHQSSDADED